MQTTSRPLDIKCVVVNHQLAIQPSLVFHPAINSHKAAFCKAFISVIYSFSILGVSKQTLALKSPQQLQHSVSFLRKIHHLNLNQAQEVKRS